LSTASILAAAGALSTAPHDRVSGRRLVRDAREETDAAGKPLSASAVALLPVGAHVESRRAKALLVASASV
jgi:hypothetical protein